jgi:hypothetical protein
MESNPKWLNRSPGSASFFHRDLTIANKAEFEKLDPLHCKSREMRDGRSGYEPSLPEAKGLRRVNKERIFSDTGSCS